VSGGAEESGERLQKVMARAGIGSRRACEALIDQRRVSVNGSLVRRQGMRVQPADEIRVDNNLIPTNPDLVVLMMNKPQGVVTSMADERGRACVGDLVADRSERLFHVGRLDAQTSGLLLLTNDGALANLLMHPSHEVAKTYRATVPGPVGADVGRRLRRGVELDDGAAAVDRFRVVDQHSGRAIVELQIHSGRNRIVRRLLAAVDHPVMELVRTRVGPVSLAGLKPGAVRRLRDDEVRALYAAAG
jgi:23S rRNA pseudouridine2605 synthase